MYALLLGSLGALIPVASAPRNCCQPTWASLRWFYPQNSVRFWPFCGACRNFAAVRRTVIVPRIVWVVLSVLLVVSAVLAIAVGRRRENERILHGRADGTAQNGH